MVGGSLLEEDGRGLAADAVVPGGGGADVAGGDDDAFRGEEVQHPLVHGGGLSGSHEAAANTGLVGDKDEAEASVLQAAERVDRARFEGDAGGVREVAAIDDHG